MARLETALERVRAGGRLAQVTASAHDHKPPLQHGPVERVAGHHGLAVNADGFPAGRALPENVDRIGLGLDLNRSGIPRIGY